MIAQPWRGKPRLGLPLNIRRKMNPRKCWRCWLNSKRYKVVRFFQTLRLVLRDMPKDLYVWAKNYWLDKKWESHQPQGYGVISNHCSSWTRYL